MKILHNHLGYVAHANKQALIRCSAEEAIGMADCQFCVLDAEHRNIVFQAPLQAMGAVAKWRDWHFFAADFSPLQQSGQFVLMVYALSPPPMLPPLMVPPPGLPPGLPPFLPPLMSQPFTIAPAIYDGQQLSDLVHYLKSQRCGGMFEQADHARPKLGSRDADGQTQLVDVHGGWYDASGDASKYLSHLSYANFMNPQQTPQVVWNLLDGFARMPHDSVWLDDKVLDEALHGADFLMRMQDAQGYFYMTVFDRWSKDPKQRDICSYATQQGHKFDSYQAGFRQGAGSAIAALARASQCPREREHTRVAYLAAAERGFAHLEQHNAAYLDDGRENIIDDYCALLAASELFAATGAPQYTQAAERRVQNLAQRQSQDGWFWADDNQTRSYFHAAEAGLPYIALMRWLEVCPQSAQAATARACLHQGLRHEVAITLHQPGNPFAYPRQYVLQAGRTGAVQFFIPHDNDSGYWWQGENARLASLASAARRASQVLTGDGALCADLLRYADASLDWIFGRNPFDVCMMAGIGHNNPRYARHFWNAPGGVCNGITSGLEDEQDIDFQSAEQSGMMHSWRWTEQWIPHGAWLFHALAQCVQAD
jgi:hypothetical protein